MNKKLFFLIPALTFSIFSFQLEAADSDEEYPIHTGREAKKASARKRSEIIEQNRALSKNAAEKTKVALDLSKTAHEKRMLAMHASHEAAQRRLELLYILASTGINPQKSPVVIAASDLAQSAEDIAQYTESIAHRFEKKSAKAKAEAELAIAKRNRRAPKR